MSSQSTNVTDAQTDRQLTTERMSLDVHWTR